MSVHHFSDSERVSYVDYINKTLANDKIDSSVVQLPLDGTSATNLFDVAKKGILFGLLINHSFPNTVNEKKLNFSPKNLFEMNINHDLSIEAAKQLGCSVVNIGASDLSSGTQHLILGLLWQIIKKALLKEVNVASNPELKELFSEAEAKEAATMSPEQILLQWINHHLKKAGYSKVIKNFQSDIADCEAYAYLLKQIAKEIPESEIEAILSEKDPVAKATKLIDAAKKILSSEQSVFVSPEDIVNPNPRLNLAFTATLFNSRPALGPSEEEIAAIESQKASLQQQAAALQKEKEHLQQQLAHVKHEKEAAEQKLKEVEKEVETTKQSSQETQVTLQKQIEEHTIAKEEVKKQLESTKGELDATKTEVKQEKESNQKLTQENQDLKSKVEQLENKVKELDTEIKQVKENTEKLIVEKESIIAQVTQDKEEKTKELEFKKIEFTQTIEQNEKQFQVTFAEFQTTKQQEVETIKINTEQTVNNKQKEHEEEIAKLKAAHDAAIAKLKEEHEAALKQLKEAHEHKITELKVALQKMQEMLPQRIDREGFLVKQGGGTKTWKKRWFILKTNFVCYYKDNKTLLHPQGVIDLNDSTVRLVSNETIKKKHCFEIVTPSRTYYVCGKNDEEVLDWIKAIDAAKAKYKNEILNRKTFYNLSTAKDDRRESNASSNDE